MNQGLIGLLALAVSLTAQPAMAQRNNNRRPPAQSQKQDPPKNNNKDGNGQGTGNGTGNVPVPADQNNIHGRVNNGGNYNNGIQKGNPANQTDVPFDAGLGVLIGAGAVTALKRARNRRITNVKG